MKKITALFPLTLALSLVMLITSCSQSNEYSSDSTESQYEFEDKYDVVLYGKYLTTDIADINKPEQLVDDSHNSGFDPDSVQKIDFLGKIYNVKYDNDKHANGVYDYYLYGYSVTDINSDVWKFALSSDGGKFAYAVMLGEDIETLSDAGTEKRTEKVKKTAESLIDISQYRFDGEEKIVLGTHNYESDKSIDEIRYEYRYIRYSGEVKTDEMLYILTDIEGNLQGVTQVYIGEFNNDSVNAFDVEHSVEAAKEKIKQVDNNDIYTVTQIDEPVLQHSGDDLYYNSHNAYGEYYMCGAVFSQETYNDRTFDAPMTILYGHGTVLGQPGAFHELNSYAEQDYFDMHRQMFVYTPSAMYVYRVFAAFVHGREHLLYYYDFSDPAIFTGFFHTVRQAADPAYSHFDDSCMPEPGDKVLALSTCFEPDKTRRYLVMGVLEEVHPAVDDTIGEE